MVPKCNAHLCYMYKSRSQIKREYEKDSGRLDDALQDEKSSLMVLGRTTKTKWVWLGVGRGPIASPRSREASGREADSGVRNASASSHQETPCRSATGFSSEDSNPTRLPSKPSSLPGPSGPSSDLLLPIQRID